MSRSSQSFSTLTAKNVLNQCAKKTILNAERILLDLSKKGMPLQYKKENAAKNLQRKICQTVQYTETQKIHPNNWSYPHVIEEQVSMSTTKAKSSLSLINSELLPLASARSPYTNYSTGTKKHHIHSCHSTGSIKAKVVTDSLRVTELRTLTGINLDLKVVVDSGDQNTKVIPVSIECPNFQPKRICFNGEWREITPPNSRMG